MYPVQPKRDSFAHDLPALRDALRAGADARVRLARRVLDDEHWDLFALVFSESHCSGHHFWKVHDASHPDHDPVLREQIGDPLIDIYEHLDASVGELIADVSPTPP